MDIETIKGDGGNRAVDAPTLGELQEEVTALCGSQQRGALYSSSADTRFCYWEGQDEDGLKHSENHTDMVEPFEGAFDSRVRDVDLVVNDEVKLLVVSALRAQLTVTDPTGENAPAAAKMQSALEYYTKRKLGSRWFRELVRVANFMTADSPGIGFMSTNWNLEEAIGLGEVGLEELQAMFLEQALQGRIEQGLSQQEALVELRALAGAFSEAVFDPETGAETLQALLAQMFPELKPARTKRMAKELLKQAAAGEANPVVEFPQKYVRKDEPDVRALRLGEDIFLPSDVRDFEEAPYYFTVHNLTRAGLEQKAREEEWSAAFKTQLLGTEESDGQKGEFAFRRYKKAENGAMRTVDDDYAAHRWQVITAVYRAANDEGVPGIYYVTFHHKLPLAAHGQRLINYKHGQLPGVAFAREYISNSLLQSRGVADVWGAQQNQRKVLMDSSGNNALLGGVPPVLSKNRRGGGRAWLKPFKEVALRRDGELKYMDPPKYPAQIRDHLDRMERDRDAYFGRSNGDLPDEAVELHKQFAVFGFLSAVRDVQVQLMQLIQQFADDETLARISGQGGQVIRSRDEIMGQFDLELKFNPRWLSTEYLTAYGEILNSLVVPLDRDKTVNTTLAAQQILYGLDPDLAPSAIRSADEAGADEVKDEQDIFARIAAGIEPEMDEDPHGKNYGLRTEWLQQQLQANPAWQAWPEINRQILQAHMENYEQMLVQQDNAQVGRAGAESVTGMV